MRNPLPQKIERGRIRDGRMGSDPELGPYGAFEVPGPCGERLAIIASAGTDSILWEHVSVSTRRRMPNWREMCFVKDLFWREDECVVQYHPPRRVYVDIHPHCLHMWRWLGGEFPMPPRITV